jgi:hypothetical protein
MANVVYPKYREACMGGSGPDLTSANVKAVLVDLAGYTYNAAHEFLSDIDSAARLAFSENLAGKSITGAVFDADDVAVIDEGDGETAEAVVVFVDTGTAATSRLLCYMDTGVTGLPLTLNGVHDELRWHASGIFGL